MVQISSLYNMSLVCVYISSVCVSFPPTFTNSHQLQARPIRDAGAGLEPVRTNHEGELDAGMRISQAT